MWFTHKAGFEISYGLGIPGLVHYDPSDDFIYSAKGASMQRVGLILDINADYIFENYTRKVSYIVH